MASKRRLRRNACEGKNRYTQDQAYHVARQRRQATAERIYAYHCRYCRAWHIGHRGPGLIPFRVKGRS